MHLGMEHFKDLYTFIDILLYSLFTVYFFFRIKLPHSLLPNKYVIDDNIDHKKMTLNKITSDELAGYSIMNLILYAAMGIKIMSYMRFGKSLGFLEFLIG